MLLFVRIDSGRYGADSNAADGNRFGTVDPLMKRSFRFSICHLFAAITIAAWITVANLVKRDIGSGIYILIQGYPFPAATNHSLNGLTIHWMGLTANVFIAVALVGISVIAVERIGRLFGRK